MPDRDNHAKLPRPSGTLEDWLQLPPDDSIDAPPDNTQPEQISLREERENSGFLNEFEHIPANDEDKGNENKIESPDTETETGTHENIESEEQPILFPISEATVSESSDPAQDTGQSEVIDGEPSEEQESPSLSYSIEFPSDMPETDIPGNNDDDNTLSQPECANVPVDESEEKIMKVAELEQLLGREFGDTLTNANSYTLPIGLILAFFSIASWFIRPISEVLELENIVKPGWFGWYIIAAVLTLASLHTLFYWLIHKASNHIKSHELDRLILLRRENHPCIHLNCMEGILDETVEGIASGGDIRINGSLDSEFETNPEIVYLWRCDLFDVELEDSPLCVVCDKYDPEEPDSDN